MSEYQPTWEGINNDTQEKRNGYLERIAEALEGFVKAYQARHLFNIQDEEKPKIRISSPGFPNAWEGEKSVSGQNTWVGDRVVSMTNPTAEPTRVVEKPVPTDSKPLPKVVQTQNFVDVRECTDYSSKSYKLIGYDNKCSFLAKQFVIRTESIKEGGTRVIVSEKSAWVIGKLEWK